jgi:hypothetical protein
MKRILLSTVFAVGLLLIGAASSPGQTEKVAGEWDGALNTPGGARPVRLIFKVDGEKLTGTAKRSSGDVPLTGTIKGADISFSYTVSYNGNDLTLIFTGKVSGDTMGGNVSFGGQADDSWSAKRVATEKPKEGKPVSRSLAP